MTSRSKSLFNTADPDMRKLLEKEAVLTDLGNASGLAYWDQDVNMPEGGEDARVKLISTLDTIQHDLQTRRYLDRLITRLEGKVDNGDFSEYDRALLRELRTDYDLASKLPRRFVTEQSKVNSKAQQTWKRAKMANDGKGDFSLFASDLAAVFDLKRREADYLGFQGHPYNALLDQYEQGLTVEQLDTIFPVLVDATKTILDRVEGAEVDRSFLSLKYPRGVQWSFARRLSRSLGFDFTRGRLDRAVHPFTIKFDPTDVRITNRADPNYLPAGVFGVIHETGHALYEQGVDRGLSGTRLATGTSMGIHESQSRFWENYVGRSNEFWEYWFPMLQRKFPSQLGSVNVDQFVKAINAVRPSPIRIEADEITYNIHVVIRYEIERDLLSGKIQTKDVPMIWNEKMRSYLGIDPQTDSQGALQDVHWSSGLVGYFPSYSLGNIYAAQFYNSLRNQHPDIDRSISKGEYGFIRQWLRENIHRHGSVYRPGDLSTNVTGEQLNPQYFVDYAMNKFGRLYGIDLKTSQLNPLHA
ncbi:MAG: carboxypeptidase M32 [Candidatus Aenigmarchaeota archaeon]|nr:carboxypeptidase M32 [Candidatus Aenigmarchaeota archaeon]